MKKKISPKAKIFFYDIFTTVGFGNNEQSWSILIARWIFLIEI